MPIAPKIKYVESFVVTGFSIRTQNKDEFNEKTAKLPNLWQQFYTSDLAATTNIFSVYSDYESGVNGLYTVTVGVVSSEKSEPLCSVNVEGGKYLVFQGIGSMPETAVETWKQVWTFFEENTDSQRNFISDFEVYSASDQVTIYIGLE